MKESDEQRSDGKSLADTTAWPILLFILIYLRWHWNLRIPAPGKAGIVLGIAAAVIFVENGMVWTLPANSS